MSTDSLKAMKWFYRGRHRRNRFSAITVADLLAEA